MASKKKVWLPPEMFEFVREVKDVATCEYKCLLGCTPPKKADGSIKFLRASNTSRHNAKRHIEVFKFFSSQLMTVNHCDLI